MRKSLNEQNFLDEEASFSSMKNRMSFVDGQGKDDKNDLSNSGHYLQEPFHILSDKKANFIADEVHGRKSGMMEIEGQDSQIVCQDIQWPSKPCSPQKDSGAFACWLEESKKTPKLKEPFNFAQPKEQARVNLRVQPLETEHYAQTLLEIRQGVCLDPLFPSDFVLPDTSTKVNTFLSKLNMANCVDWFNFKNHFAGSNVAVEVEEAVLEKPVEWRKGYYEENPYNPRYSLLEDAILLIVLHNNIAALAHLPEFMLRPVQGFAYRLKKLKRLSPEQAFAIIREVSVNRDRGTMRRCQIKGNGQIIIRNIYVTKLHCFKSSIYSLGHLHVLLDSIPNVAFRDSTILSLQDEKKIKSWDDLSSVYVSRGRPEFLLIAGNLVEELMRLLSENRNRAVYQKLMTLVTFICENENINQVVFFNLLMAHPTTFSIDVLIAYVTAFKFLIQNVYNQRLI
jgi:hypothetical protein